jgi:flagellar hook-basal body complex protein FliE
MFFVKGVKTKVMGWFRRSIRKIKSPVHLYFIGMKPEPVLSEDIKEILDIVADIHADTRKLDGLEEIEQIMCNVEEQTYEISKFSSTIHKRTKKMEESNKKFEKDTTKVIKGIKKAVDAMEKSTLKD